MSWSFSKKNIIRRFLCGDNTSTEPGSGDWIYQGDAQAKNREHFCSRRRADLIVRDETYSMVSGGRCLSVHDGLEYHRNPCSRTSGNAFGRTGPEGHGAVKKHKMMVMATLLIGHWEETEGDRKVSQFLREICDHLVSTLSPLSRDTFFNNMKKWEELWIGYRNYDYLHG